MSENALRDLNVLPVAGLDKNNDVSSKVNLSKTYTESNNGNGHKMHNENSTMLSSTLPNDVDVDSNGAEKGNAEVEYIDSENLEDLTDLGSSLDTLLARLDSKEWISVCEALNNVRQISIYHKEKLHEKLEAVIPLVVKSLKNPRSAVCKTAIMTSADIFKACSDSIVDLFEPLLGQLLLKSSQDKKFVCEAAEAALIAMTTWVSPSLLLPKLMPYLINKNPRLRAKASFCISRSVPRLGLEGIQAYGIDKLIQIAASQLSDKLPESREAARALAMELQTIYVKSQALPSGKDSPGSIDADSWEAFCQSKLSPLSAQAILRVTSAPKEGLVLGS